MRTLTYFCILYFIFQNYCKAQSSSIGLPYPSDACTGSNYNVTVYPSSFSNGVTIEILLSNDNFVSSVVIGSSTFTGAYSQVINCTIPIGTTNGSNYKVKASATGVLPANNYSSSVFKVISGLPSASLSGSLDINACGGSANLPIQILGNGPFTYQYQRTGDYYSQTGTSTLNTPLVTTYQAGTYTLLSVSNACGAGTVSATPNNSAIVTVVAPIITMGTPSDDIVCIGNKIKIPFTTNQPCTNFTIQLSDNTGNNYTNTTTLYDQYYLPNILIATIPNLTQTPGSGYKLKIKVTVNADTYFSDPSVAPLSLKPKPSISLLEILEPIDNIYPAIIAKGENLKMRANLIGTPPFILKLNDITTTILSGSSFDFQISPSKDNRYLTGPLTDATGCVSEIPYYSNIEVKDYIFKNRILENKSLDIYSKFRIFCKNEYIHLDYSIRTAQHPDSIFVQISNYDKLNKGISDWVNAEYEKSADNQLSIKIPYGLEKGRYSLRLIPRNPAHTYKSYDYTIINDDMTSTDFILMDVVLGEMPSLKQIVVSPNEPFYLFYKFVGGPDYYGNYLGSLKVYKPILKTNKGQTIKYSSIIGQGFNSLTGKTKIDTVTKSITYYLTGVEASTAAAGDLSCTSSQAPLINDSLSVIVIPNDPSRSISTGIIANPNNLCGGSNIVVPFTTIGTFNPGNIFKVQLQEYESSYSTIPNSNFYDTPTILGLNPNELIATLPINANNPNAIYYKVRIVSSNPGVIGSISSTLLNINKRPPYIELTGDAYVVAGEKAKIKAKTSTAYPYFNFKVSDGTWESSLLSSGSFNLNYFSDITVDTSPTAIVGSTINFTANIASNSCGNSINVGQGTVQIVAAPKISITAPNPVFNCNPGKIKTTFSNTLNFSNDNTFSAKIWHNYYGSPSYVSGIVIKKADNTLSIEIPSTYIPVNGLDYFMQISSSSPFANSNIVSFKMNNSPSFYFNPSSVNVDLGESTNLTYTLSGTPNFSFQISNNDGENSISTALTNYIQTITPLYSKPYYLSKLVDANCPAITSTGGPTVTVIEKKQSIEIESFSKSSICLGSSILVPFLSNGSFSTFILQISDANAANYIDIPTTITGNILTGTVPVSLIAGENYRIRIKGTLTIGGEQFSLPNLFGLVLKESVTASLSGNDNLVKNVNFQNFITPDKELRVDFTGIGPYTFQLFNGTSNTLINTTSNPHFIKVNPSSSTTYTITNLSNECGTGSSTGIATINVIQLTTGIFPSDVCYGQVLSVPFTETGTFSPSNQYFLDFQFLKPYDNSLAFNYNFRTLPAIRSGNNLLVTIPADFPTSTGIFVSGTASFFKIRVRTTSPEALGSWGIGNLGVYSGAPSIKIFGSTNLLTGGASTPLSFISSNNAGYTSVNYTINDIGPYTLSFYGNAYTFNVNPSITSTYVITSIYSSCGSGLSVNPTSATVTVGPCPTNQSLSLNMETGIIRKFETSGILDAINTIKSGSNIKYDAQISIILNPGFKVENGAIFSAYIDGCGGF